MRRKQYRVRLTDEQRRQLRGVIRSGQTAARTTTRARILLKADERAEAWSDQAIAQALDVSVTTVQRIRKRFAQAGLPAAIESRPSPPRPHSRRLDGQAEAKLIALACSQPPEGHERWTLDLLSDRMVSLNYVPAVSRDTVRRALKKKRTEALAEAAVVHSAGAVGRVRVADGRRVGRIPAAV